MSLGGHLRPGDMQMVDATFQYPIQEPVEPVAGTMPDLGRKQILKQQLREAMAEEKVFLESPEAPTGPQANHSKKPYTPEPRGSNPAAKTITDPAELLRAFAMKDEYVEKLGKERFLFKDLLIGNHILTMIAMPGGGKTTFFFYHVSPALAEAGLKVWYCDFDSPASDHKRMKDTADRHGFTLLNPDTVPGADMGQLLDTLREIADSSADLAGWVFVVDTLKKVADLMSKGSIKSFYMLARKLCNLGATVVLLAHANKFRDKEGNLVFEGCGDVRSDTDELIFLERVTNPNGGIDVSTICDPDRGAKVRGIFKPFSFHVSESREITFYENPLPIIDHNSTATPRATDDEILTAIKKYLFGQTEPVAQKQLVQHAADITGSGEKRVRQILVRNAEARDSMHHSGMAFLYSVGPRNSHSYELPK